MRRFGEVGSPPAAAAGAVLASAAVPLGSTPTTPRVVRYPPPAVGGVRVKAIVTELNSRLDSGSPSSAPTSARDRPGFAARAACAPVEAPPFVRVGYPAVSSSAGPAPRPSRRYDAPSPNSSQAALSFSPLGSPQPPSRAPGAGGVVDAAPPLLPCGPGAGACAGIGPTGPGLAASQAADRGAADAAETTVDDGGSLLATSGVVPPEVPVEVLLRCRPPADPEACYLRISCSSTGRSHSSSAQAVVMLEAPPRVVGERLGRALLSLPTAARAFRCNTFLGEAAGQEDVFAHAAPVVDRVMEGYNGTIFCYGITGSGKTHTMAGPPQESAGRGGRGGGGGEGGETSLEDGGAAAEDRGKAERHHGIAQRAARRIFEFVRDRAGCGEVFAVEASFLEICPHEGGRDALVDLLAEASEEALSTKLEVRQDPLNPRAFSCEGLRRLPIASPSELCEALELGRRRAAVLETTRNRSSSRSHCLFIIRVERMSPATSDSPALPCFGKQDRVAPSSRVSVGKLVLVDLAGSESLKKVLARDEACEDMRRKQAIGINRALASLGAVVNNLNAGFECSSAGFRSSALTMLLKDCLGGRARALLIATMSPEAEWASETFTTLTFAQQMMQVRNVEQATYVDGSKSTLVQMQQRQLQCMQKLQEQQQQPTGNDTSEQARGGQECQRLQGEVASLERHLLTKDSAAAALLGSVGTLEAEAARRRKMEEVKDEVSKVMAQEFAALQEQSCKDFEGLRQLLEGRGMAPSC
mmetsp:Transcript_178586/g.572458  ORF Transcript_178586/g.572458 Transcript_178586/m.572458 type:complete len:756 (-) Transcript_178586:112-2379(-)